MRQHFADQAMLKVPQIMHANLRHFPAALHDPRDAGGVGGVDICRAPVIKSTGEIAYWPAYRAWPFCCLHRNTKAVDGTCSGYIRPMDSG